ncbi:helix-turn-helix domain-containing protein [Sphingobium yanoikuyae]|uniref:helix-turn-helix domain-containing protein n=1 Tax=Sphingobium yanoikuyae TaxID=13690 RepID=UPI0035C83C0E
MTNLAFADTDLEVEFVVRRPGGGKVSCVRNTSSTVIALDRSQERALPAGAELLEDFLDQFDADPAVAEHLPAARRRFARASEEVGAAVTLRQLRLAQGLSQGELASAIGTSQAAVSAIESRRRKPGEDTIRALSAILQVDFNTLMVALQNG